MPEFCLQTKPPVWNQSRHCSRLDRSSEAGEEFQPGAAFELQGGLFDDPLPSPQSCLSCDRYARQGFFGLCSIENAAQMSPSLLHVCCAQLTGN